MEKQITKLDKTKFKDSFGSWWPKIEKFFDAGGFDKIYEFLKKESTRGISIAPESCNTFRAFRETDISNVKTVIVGLAPYHSFYNGKPIADGLALSCSITGKLQPSLFQWYNALENELYNGLCAPCIKNPDLLFLSHQGVLLLNVALTTSKNKPGDHVALWEPFIKFLFEEVFDTIRVPIILLGRETAKVEKYIALFTWTFKLTHPANSSYNNTDWDSEGTFKKVDKILLDTNNHKIEWLDLIK